MKKYTTAEVCAIVGITQPELTRAKNGQTVKRNGKIEWSKPALLDASDYEETIGNHRMRTYFYESAVEKIKNARLKKKTKRLRS
jgi:hypothetical protein